MAMQRRQQLLTFGVFYYAWHFALHHGDGGVCGSQVNADDLALDLLIRVVPPEARI
jgi:hypothetical protein